MTQLTEEDVDRFAQFLRQYYKQDVAELATHFPNDSKTLEIDYTDVLRWDVDVADDLIDHPGIILEAFEEAISIVDIPVDIDLTGANISIVNTQPNFHIPELRSEYLGKYISVTGMAEEITQVNPEIQIATWECQRCGVEQETRKVGEALNEPYECQSCNREGPFLLKDSKSDVKDKQLIKLKPLPEDSQGDTTDDLRILAYDDLVGVVNPGDRLRVNGVFKMDTEGILNESTPDATRETYMRAYGFETQQESFEEIEPERIEEIKALASQPDIYEKLRESFAPHILTNGYENKIKEGVIFQLFNGVRRDLPNGATRRGDINVLMVGEPGTGKSQFINTAKEIAPKGVKASGKGATAAGLTATAEKSELTGSWTLKAGALVQANEGFVGIDEFDKMDDSAIKSMHEALEDQEIPINKAGINVTLPAKCSVLAGANPEHGVYDRYTPLMEQIDLGPTIISRFDLVFGLTSNPDEETDKAIAKHQLKHEGNGLEPEIDVELLREYIAYARRIKPVWPNGEPEDMIAEYYADIRQEANGDDMAPGPRINDALRRLSEASARIRLSEVVEPEDVERAIDLENTHIGMVALDEDGNLNASKMRGDRTVKDKKMDEFEQLKPKILDVIGDTVMFPDEISRELSVGEAKVKEHLETMATKGDVIDRNGKYEAT